MEPDPVTTAAPPPVTSALPEIVDREWADVPPPAPPTTPATAPTAAPPPNRPAVPASRFDAEKTLAKEATQVIGDAIGRVAPNLSPELRLVVGAAIALFLFGALSMVGRYPFIMLGLALAIVAGVILYARARRRLPAAEDPSGSRGTPLPRGRPTTAGGDCAGAPRLSDIEDHCCVARVRGGQTPRAPGR